MDAAPAHFAPAPSAVVTAFTDPVISFDHLIRAHDLRQDNALAYRGATPVSSLVSSRFLINRTFRVCQPPQALLGR